MRTTVVTLAVVLLLGAPAVAPAAELTAREHFEKGTTLYDLGQFRDAAREYEAAYKLKSDPALLYNIGQAYRFAGDASDALRAYRAYLRRVPDASNKREVEAQIAKLQRLIDEQRATATSPPTGTMTPGQPTPTTTITTPPPTTTTAQPQPTPHPAVLTAQPAARPAERTPLYKKWWLWTVVGVVVAGAVVTGAVVATTPSDAPSPPNTFGVSLH